MNKTWCLIPIGLLMLAACQTPTPSAPVAQATVTARPIVQVATSTAVPSVMPTVVPTSAPTATPTPTATLVAVTATVTPTDTLPSTLPASTSTPNVPTATSTKAPATRVTATTPVTPAATITPTAVTPTPTPTKAPTPIGPATREVYVNSDGVNLRAAPGTNENVLQVLTQGSHLIALDQPTAPDASGIAWQNVRTNDGRSGWVAAQLLSAATPTPTPALSPTGTPVVTPSAQAGYVYVSSIDGLNLRAGHSATSSIIAQLINGQRLQTNGLGFGPDPDGLKWLNVKTADGLVGWASADYLSTEVPSVKPAEPPANEQAIANELLRRTNALRQQNGLPPYTVDLGLNQLALGHSEYMSQNGLTHNDAEGRSATKRLAGFGYGGRPTENIYFSGDFEDAWTFWSTDPDHKPNLLNTVNTVIGIGVMKVGFIYYLTQDFAVPPQ
jgi:uncharacterized protein YkwD/SH3-like domain-containing protein